MPDSVNFIWDLSAELTAYVVGRQEQLLRMSQADEPKAESDLADLDEASAELVAQVAQRLDDFVRHAVAATLEHERCRERRARFGSTN
jgi:hypothetical protein